MKRVLAAALALAMLMSLMTLNASAVYSTDGNNFNTDNAGNSSSAGQTAVTGLAGEEVGSATVDVKIKTGGDGSITHVYAVSYDVTELQFTYGQGADIIWNPETLQYETSSAGGGWTADSQEIKVTNYSDLPVKIEAQVQNKNDAGVTITPDGPLELGTAATNGTAGKGEEQTGKITVTISGAPVGSYTSDYTKVAEILLTVTNNVT